LVLHDLRCRQCGRFFRDEGIEITKPISISSCVECGGERYITYEFAIGGGRDWFKPGYWEHMQTPDEQPLFIESKEHLKAECDKRGVYARCLLEEINSKRCKQEITPTRRPAVEREKRLREIESQVVENARRIKFLG